MEKHKKQIENAAGTHTALVPGSHKAKTDIIDEDSHGDKKDLNAFSF